MNPLIKNIAFSLLLPFVFISLKAQDPRSFKVFQFPANRIPVINGDISDWKIVPDSYTVGMDELWDDSGKNPSTDSSNFYMEVKTGWVKGLERLYFLIRIYDNYWDFSGHGLRNDTFELVVDGDQSGGPLIDRFHPNKSLDSIQAFLSFHGVHAQNYHIFTPAVGKDWTLVWGAQPWIKDLPFANAAYQYDFNHGEAGFLNLEFWITPFDYAGHEGPERAVKSILRENKNIALSWAYIDYDEGRGNNGFWNLSLEHTMFGNADYLLPFKLMPLEDRFKKDIEAAWSFKILDQERRVVAFQDESTGEITSWNWDFGDGKTSIEQHPVHSYENPGKYIVVLRIEGAKGKSQLSKIWEVVIK